ncbi:MAG: chromosomal replication initiator protein DnaA [Elusimicrobia bacterium]|nr:chromosomal replication initiator protein DnaA [Elusimicrobiota bacterium]
MDNIDLKTLWQFLVSRFEEETSKDIVDMWLKPVTPLSLENNALKLEVPDQVLYETLRERYESLLVSLLKKITDQDIQITYTVPLASSAAPAAIFVSPNPAAQGFPNRLNPNYTFDGFIEGPSNRFACASAQAVVKRLGDRLNNPLVLYSNPGLGKTHLLHAIGNEIIKNNPSAKALYMSGEEFVNEYIGSLQNKTSEFFRNKYRNLDCFLVDDIQFVAGKTSSETEFFYTFNALFESKKQIVLTSDRLPSELSLDKRLSSRLLSGIVAGIKPPDMETRIAILRAKKEAHHFTIADDVVVFIASSVISSIREMEGCLLRLNGYCMSHSVEPTVEIAKEVLSDVIKSSAEAPVSMDTIKKVVAKHYSLSVEDLIAQKRTESISFPRQIAMYLADELTDLSLPEIGKAFDKDHSTVIHSRDKIRRLVEADPFFTEKLNKIRLDVKNAEKSGV